MRNNLHIPWGTMAENFQGPGAGNRPETKTVVKPDTTRSSMNVTSLEKRAVKPRKSTIHMSCGSKLAYAYCSNCRKSKRFCIHAKNDRQPKPIALSQEDKALSISGASVLTIR